MAQVGCFSHFNCTENVNKTPMKQANKKQCKLCYLIASKIFHIMTNDISYLVAPMFYSQTKCTKVSIIMQKQHYKNTPKIGEGIAKQQTEENAFEVSCTSSFVLMILNMF